MYQGGLVDDKARNRVLLVLFIGVLMGALDIAIVAPALPTIRDYFGVDDRAAAWIQRRCGNRFRGV